MGRQYRKRARLTPDKIERLAREVYPIALKNIASIIKGNCDDDSPLMTAIRKYIHFLAVLEYDNDEFDTIKKADRIADDIMEHATEPFFDAGNPCWERLTVALQNGFCDWCDVSFDDGADEEYFDPYEYQPPETADA